MLFGEQLATYAELLAKDGFNKSNLCGSEAEYKERDARNREAVNEYLETLPKATLTVREARRLHLLRNQEMNNYAGVINGDRFNPGFTEIEDKSKVSGTCGPQRLPSELALLDDQLSLMRAGAKTAEDRMKVNVFMSLRMFAIHPFNDGNKRLFRDMLGHYLKREHDLTLPANWPGLSSEAVIAAMKGNNLGPICLELNRGLKLRLDEAQLSGPQISAYKIMPELQGEYRMTEAELKRVLEHQSLKQNWLPIYPGQNLEMAAELQRARHSHAAICGAGPLLREETIAAVFGPGSQQQLAQICDLDELMRSVWALDASGQLGEASEERICTLMRHACYAAGVGETRQGGLSMLAVLRNSQDPERSFREELALIEDQWEKAHPGTLRRDAWLNRQISAERVWMEHGDDMRMEAVSDPSPERENATEKVERNQGPRLS